MKRLSISQQPMPPSLTVQHLLEQISPRKREGPPPSPRRIMPGMSRLSAPQKGSQMEGSSDAECPKPSDALTLEPSLHRPGLGQGNPQQLSFW